jgi:uncharacterized protein YbaA (DUF1428 family)
MGIRQWPDRWYVCLHRDAAGAKEDETVIFTWIVYTSREHRDEVNKKVMVNPRFKAQGLEAIPFSCKHLAHAGFKTIVEF